jgi:hypothetical protein
MKVLSYSLFGDPSSFEFGFYLRGIYFNARMNRILYPDFVTVVNIDKIVNANYKWIMLDIGNLFDIQVSYYQHDERCKSMLQRMWPIWVEGVTHVLCRDADSVPTYREASCVYEWLQSGLPYHAINDNDAHAGLMGGLVGFRSEDFKRDTGYTSFDQMIQGQDLRKHGSDQNFMNKFIHPKIKNGLLMHKLKGQGIEAKRTETVVPSGHIDKKYVHSDLIARYIGSAGVIDFELLRWFKDHDPNPKFDEFERKYSNIFYWAR